MARTGFAHRLYTGEISYDFVGKRKIWYLISGTLILVSILAIGVRGLNFGIEFRGGADFQAPVAVSAETVTRTTDAVQALNMPDNDDLTVTTIGGGTVRVQTRPLSTAEVAEVKQAIADVSDTSVENVAYSLIGASWGQQITQQALIALVVFLALVMLLIWAYFRDFKMSLSAIIALMHDLIITVGVYALVGFSITPATMIGVLTILGYSLYDTVVVFDKIRENVADIENSRSTYAELANLATNQVLIRSLNTTIIGVLPVAALLATGAFVLGTGPLKDLGLALFVGMVAGAYSSIFIASPILAEMREAEPEMKEHRARLERRAARAAKRGEHVTAGEARTANVTVALDEAAPVEDVSTLGLVPAEVVKGERAQPVRQPRSARRK